MTLFGYVAFGLFFLVLIIFFRFVLKREQDRADRCQAEVDRLTTLMSDQYRHEED